MKVASFEAEQLAVHNCQKQHQQEEHENRFLETCSGQCQRFRAFPHTITQLSWKGIRLDSKEGQYIVSTVVGGEGEALAWHSIGKQRKTRFYNM